MINPFVQQLNNEITAFRIRYGQGVTDINILAWRGYLIGLYQYTIISEGEYTYLLHQLPPIKDVPGDDVLCSGDQITVIAVNDTYQWVAELEGRLHASLYQYGNPFNERQSAVWDGYFAGLYMHGGLSLDEFSYLSDQLVGFDHKPVVDIFRGVDEDPLA